MTKAIIEMGSAFLYNRSMSIPRRDLALITVAVVVALVIGSFAALTKYQVSGVKYQGTQRQAGQATATSVPVDWKTYRSEQYGLAFRYPQNWSLYAPLISDNQIVGIHTAAADTPSEDSPSAAGYCKLDLFSVSNPAHAPIQDWLIEYAKDNNDPAPRLTTTTVAQKNGFREVAAIDVDRMSDYVYVLLRDPSMFLSMGIICGNDILPEGEAVFNKILSTFAFTQ